MQIRGTIAFASWLVCGMVLPAAGQAPSAPSAGDLAKIAVVQFQPAVTATNEFQRDLAGLQKRFEPKRNELKTLNDEIESLTKQLEADGGKLSQAEQENRARTIDNKKKQAQRLAEDAQNDYSQALQDLFNRIAAKVGEVLDTYAKEHGLTLVMDRAESQEGTPVVLWATPSLDITRPVVDAYNAKSGVPAQATGLPPAPTPSASK